MPASTGNGHGKVWWGSDLPVRYDIAIRGDSVSLDDVNWVYPTLPRTGGGSLDLFIKNDPTKKLQLDRLQAVEDGREEHQVASDRRHDVRDRRAGAARAATSTFAPIRSTSI